jgi:predicted flap endonuclease-1-like 5' DNA nuclease
VQHRIEREDATMNPIGSPLWTFVAGLLVGWVLSWLVQSILRRRPPAHPVEPGSVIRHPGAVAALTPAPPSSGETHMSPLPPSRLIDVGAARAAGFNMKHADDLTIIEGIGPKLDDLLRANGIRSFAQVAVLRVDEIADVLERGGPHFQLANPTTWAEQAALAADNRWSDLKHLQKAMIGDLPPHENV